MSQRQKLANTRNNNNSRRKGTRRRRRRRAPAAASTAVVVSTAGVVTTSNPRPYLRFVSASGDIVRIRGHDMLTTIFTSRDTRKSGPYLLNPAIANVFPRVSPLAITFEKFRFVNLCAHYHSAAPTTRSGQVAFCLLSDPEAQNPSDIIEVYNYEHSSVSPIGMSASTPIMRFPASKWYYTNAISSPDQAFDPTKRFAGKLFVMSSRTSASDD